MPKEHENPLLVAWEDDLDHERPKLGGTSTDSGLFVKHLLQETLGVSDLLIEIILGYEWLAQQLYRARQLARNDVADDLIAQCDSISLDPFIRHFQPSRQNSNTFICVESTVYQNHFFEV